MSMTEGWGGLSEPYDDDDTPEPQPSAPEGVVAGEMVERLKAGASRSTITSRTLRKAAEIIEAQAAEIAEMRLQAISDVGQTQTALEALAAAQDRVARLSQIVDVARELVSTGMVNRGVDRGLVVIEKADKSDPHYRLCTLLEADTGTEVKHG